MAKAVVCIAKTEDQAAGIVDQLRAAGFSKDDVSILLPDRTGGRDFAHERHTKAPEGATTGAIVGGVLAGGLGWLIGSGSLSVPGVGILMAAGPIMAALSAAAAGGAVGVITGAIIGMDIPELEAKPYEGKIRDGNIVISVHAEDGKERAAVKQVFKQAHAMNISIIREAGVEANGEV